MSRVHFTKFFSSILLFTLLTTSLFAVDLNSYIELAQSGTAMDIQDAFKKSPELRNQTFGDNKETFLIIAIKNNRPVEIISLLVKAGCKVKTKSKDNRTTVMYAAKFNRNPDVLKLLIKECAITKSGRQKYLYLTDDNGFTAFDYGKQNDNSATIMSILNEYEDTRKLAKEEKARRKEEEKAEKTKKKQEEKEEKERLKEEKARQKEEAKASKKEKAKEKEEAEEKEEVPSVKEEPAQTEPQPVPQTQTQPQAPAINTARQYTNDDFFKNEYTEDDFIDSFDSFDSASTKSDVSPKNNKPSKQDTWSSRQNTRDSDILPENNTDRLTQPYTKSYLFDYITDNTPEVPEEETESTITVQLENVDKQDRNGITLLMKAAKAGNDWDIQNLLANNANVQLRDKEGWTALMYAVRYQNNLSIVKKLIEAGAHVRVRNNYNSTPLLMAANYTQNPEILKLLLKNRTASEDEVYAAFILVLTSEEGAEHVKVSKLKILLEMGISVNRLWKGKTPLMYACQYGNSTEAIKLLLDSGARASIQNQDGMTAFDYAGQNSALPHDEIYWSINSIGR